MSNQKQFFLVVFKAALMFEIHVWNEINLKKILFYQPIENYAANNASH